MSLQANEKTLLASIDFIDAPHGIIDSANGRFFSTVTAMHTLVSAAHDAPPDAAEHHFASHDNMPLFYRAWLPDDTIARGVILLHRGHEYSGRWDEADPGPVHVLAPRSFAWDARGHGRSPGATRRRGRLSPFTSGTWKLSRGI